ncbi:MAG: OmpH family outer membrane protein [Candidatus Tritonobacter lacicola]|nr:OmpH family outer membrane protein [Candidatus Tritonobacter lacicola]
MGYVNIDSVFEQYEKTRAASEKMESERKQRLEKRREMVEEINRLKDAADLLSEQAKKEKQKVIDGKVKDLYQYEEETKRKNMRESRRLREEIMDEVQEVLKLKGDKDGYDFIFIYTEEELGYRSKKYDITGAIVDMLNERFRKESGR